VFIIIPTRILTFAGGLFFLIALIYSLANAVTLFGSAWRTISTLAAAFSFVLIVVHWVCFHMSRKIFLTVFLSLGFSIRIVWILWNPAPPASDFLFMYNAALNAVSGDFSFAQSAYYTSFPYQLGFTMYEASIIRLFGNPLFVFKLLNVLFSMGTAIVIYYCASRTFHENCGRISTLIYIFYVPNIIMCSVLTNQHLSTFLFLLGFLLLKRWDSNVHWLLAGLLLGLGNLMRPIGIVYLAAIVLFFLLEQWWQQQASSKRQRGIAATKLAGVIAVFYLVQSLASVSLISAGVTQNSLSGGDRYWKFMVGLNAGTNGSWSLDDARYANQYPFGEARDHAELTRIKERLENKPKVAALMGRKLVLMWGSADSSAFWSLQGTDRGDWERLLNKWERTLYVLMCAFGLAAMMALWRSGQHRDHLLYLILLLLYAAVHLLIENQTRYRLDLIPGLILLQSYGVYHGYVWVRKLQFPLASTPKASTGKFDV
jgi:4-amino-4-deoxy-L-arabinose transferase-like glycosyltransferase